MTTESHRVSVPSPSDLAPLRRARTARGTALRAEVRVLLEVTTPIMGGAARTREIDNVDVIRPGTVRGALRFWWRAIHASQHPNASSLKNAEAEFWGQAALEKKGGRSPIDLRVALEKEPGELDSSNIDMGAKDAYALWPAREQRERGAVKVAAAPRRLPGTQFALTLHCPADQEEDVRRVLKAWILFGGYGGRTRRGAGSLQVVAERERWLPERLDRVALKALFGLSLFESTSRSPCDTPMLSGSTLIVGTAETRAESAWHRALAWIRDFRQGAGPFAAAAREPGDGRRPGRSRWPEADKLRHLAEQRGHAWAHPLRPEYGSTPAWPRAGFGLPIVGQFQGKNRDQVRWGDLHPPLREPGPFELVWEDAYGRMYERLASPLILKPVPLRDGKFVPAALWLHRAYPKKGLVGTKVRGQKRVDDRSRAPFDRLVGKGDTPLFKPLQDARSLREAFMGWAATKGTQVTE